PQVRGPSSERAGQLAVSFLLPVLAPVVLLPPYVAVSVCAPLVRVRLTFAVPVVATVANFFPLSKKVTVPLTGEAPGETTLVPSLIVTVPVGLVAAAALVSATFTVTGTW